MTNMDRILPAIAASIGSVSKLGKGDVNKHQNYNFASIDKFLEMVNPICAENGLVFHMQETGIEEFTRNASSGPQAWFRMHYEITVYHVSGQSLPPVTRTVEVPRTGAQASGSAQSYCLKQFMRSLFMIPTGDKDDADFRDHGSGEIVKDAPAPKPVKKISSAEMKRQLIVFQAELAECQTLVALQKLKAVWLEKMDKDGWPRSADGEDEEYSFRTAAQNYYATRKLQIEEALEVENEPEQEAAE